MKKCDNAVTIPIPYKVKILTSSFLHRIPEMNESSARRTAAKRLYQPKSFAVLTEFFR